MARLRAPLQEPLKAVADLERHMDIFMLAAKKMTLSGQGEQPYEYFEAFLATVEAFPVVAGSMSTYYAVQPTADHQTIEPLFPYLKAQHPYMLQTAGASPFSGAATPPAAPMAKTTKKAKNAKRAVWGPYGQQRAPHHQGNFSGGAQGPHVVPWDPQSAMAEIQRLNALLMAQAHVTVPAAMMAENFNAYGTHTGSREPVPQVHYVGMVRSFYCYVHGSNTSHPGPVCKVMAQDPRYTVDMKTATSAATGGNPNVGPPVTFHRSPVAILSSTNACLPCALSSMQGHAKREAPPYDESVSAGLAIRAQARNIRGADCPSRARADEQSCLPLEFPVSSLPVVSLSVVPSVCFPPCGT